MQNITTAAQLFATVNARIEAIGDATEQLTEKAKTAPRCEIQMILDQMVALANEHENLIPHWHSLRFLMNAERIEGCKDAAH